MADLSKVKVGTVVYNLKDAEGRNIAATITNNLNAEITRAQAAEATLTADLAAEVTNRTNADTALSTRIEALEARGRFLSSWNCVNGEPVDYPEIPSSATESYVYEYKVGDYYLVGTVAGTGESNLQPSGGYIKAVKSGNTWTWTVGTAAETREVGVGDYYICSTVSGEGELRTATWVWVANSQKTVSFVQISGQPTDNTNLATALNAKVDKTQTIAGLNLQDNITQSEMQEALGLASLAYASVAKGTVTAAGSVGITHDAIKGGTITLNDLTQTATAATISYKAYTPAGSVSLSGSAIKGGSISVTLKDAAAASEATISYENYTPQGTIAATTAGSFTALKSATFVADDAGIQIGGAVSAPTINITNATYNVLGSVASAGVAPTFTEGAFTAATINDGFYTAGSAATWTGATYTAPSLGDATKSAFATEGLKAAVDETDTEMLVFSAASTADAVTAQGSLTAGSVDFGTFDGGSATQIDVTKFSGGSKAADTFDAGSMPTFNNKEVKEVAALSADAPVFTGNKYRVATSSDTALKEVEFTGTAAAIKANKVEYLKQAINSASFSGEAASLSASFSGTEVSDIAVQGVQYSKAAANGATFNPVGASITASFTGTAVEVSVTPVAD